MLVKMVSAPLRDYSAGCMARATYIMWVLLPAVLENEDGPGNS